MNWFTKNLNVKVDGDMDTCDHLKEGDVAHIVHNEVDSFGYVGRTAYCKACEEERHTEAEEEKEFCNDCNNEFPNKELKQWKWYDFYAPQGDEPYIICKCCWDKPKHQNRLARDAKDMENELRGSFFNDDYDD